MDMTNTQHAATNELAAMLARKVSEAQANGATYDQAIEAVRQLWLDALKES